MRNWSQKRERHAVGIRAEAAEPVIRRIRRHRSEAPGSFGPVFDALERHVFEHSFDVATLCKIAHQNAVNFSKRFGPVVGMTPKAYIDSCRLETGWGMLASDLTMREIAEVLGYRSTQVFTDAFTRWYGLHPKTYRDELGHLLRSGLVTPGRPTSENVMLAVVRKAPAAPPGKLARLRRFLRLDEAQPEPEIEPRYRRRRDRRCTWSGIDARKHPSSSGGG